MPKVLVSQLASSNSLPKCSAEQTTTNVTQLKMAVRRMPGADSGVATGAFDRRPRYIRTMSKSKSAPTFADYEKALTQMLDENEELQAELTEVKERLAAFMGAFEENGTLGILQLMAHDTSLPPEIRIRAAGLAVPFERPKLAVTATTSVPLYDLLEARRRKGKVI